MYCVSGVRGPQWSGGRRRFFRYKLTLHAAKKERVKSGTKFFFFFFSFFSLHTMSLIWQRNQNDDRAHSLRPGSFVGGFNILVVRSFVFPRTLSFFLSLCSLCVWNAIDAVVRSAAPSEFEKRTPDCALLRRPRERSSTVWMDGMKTTYEGKEAINIHRGRT